MYTTANPVVGRLHCPQCKGEQITPIVESSVDGAMTTHSSNGRFSSTTVSNTHRNYWMCSTCGNKFRNIQNLEQEIEKMKKGVFDSDEITAIVDDLCIENPMEIFFAEEVTR